MRQQIDDLWAAHGSTIDNLIDDAVHRVMRRFYKFVDRDDVRQECLFWCLKHPNKVTEYLDEDRTYSLVKALENHGITYAQKEKAQRSGYSPDDVFYWSTADIEALLPSLFSNEARLNPPSMGEDDPSGRSNRPASEGGNWIATLADLSRVYNGLDQRSKRVLFEVYGLDYTRVKVAWSLGVSDTTVGNVIERAVRKMHRELGGHRPRTHQDCDECTGTRRVISNAHANAITRSSYDDE